MTASYWFDGWSDADPIDSGYPLWALASDSREAGPPAKIDSSGDRAVVEQIRAGDERAFERLYTEQAANLLGYAYRLSGSRTTAQDVVADLFVHLWERRVEWRPQGSVRAYLYIAVRHRVSNVLRTERRADLRAGKAVKDSFLVGAPPPAPDAELEAMPGDERLAAVWKVVDEFPPLRRQVMYLRWGRGLSVEEVAAVLGLNRNAIDKHLSRAIYAIRTALPHLIARD